MTVSHCMHHALRISKRPRDSWKNELSRVPDACEHGCKAPYSCRQRVSEYLDMQSRMEKLRRRR